MSQIETIMLVALGFAIAALIALFLSRFFWAVALRLGNKRLLRSTPTTIAELRADRDRLRAEYAMLSRKLQLKMDNIKTRLAEQMAEVTRNRNRIDHLIVEVRSRDALLAERAGEISRLKAHVDPLETELASRTQSVQSSREQLRGRDAELARHQKAVEQLKAEIAERDRHIEALKYEAVALKNEAAGKDISYMRATSEVLTAQDRLKKRIEDLTSLSSQMETQRLELADQKNEFESLKSELAFARSDPEPVAMEEPRSQQEEFVAEPALPEDLLEETAAAPDQPAPQQELAFEAALPEATPLAEATNLDQTTPEPATGIDTVAIDEQPAAAAGETGEPDAEPRNLDRSFSARIAELKVNTEEPAAETLPETLPKPPENESDAESASAHGKLRAVTNVISLAARIRALQKTAGE